MPAAAPVFGLSLQRSGTKSLGHFGRANGYHVCSWRESHEHGLSELWFLRRFDALGAFVETAGYDFFEDSPWWHGDLFKWLVGRFPAARFICLERPAEDWFRSLYNHSAGLSPGNALIHGEIYSLLGHALAHNPAGYAGWGASTPFPLLDNRAVYLEHHRRYHAELPAYFRATGAADRLFHAPLYDCDWEALGRFLGLAEVRLEGGMHRHRTQVDHYGRDVAGAGDDAP